MTEEKSKLNTKIEKLDKIIDWFNSEEFVLEKAVDRYKEAKKLADKIETELNELKNEVEVLADLAK